jgi:hypothetical protein
MEKLWALMKFCIIAGAVAVVAGAVALCVLLGAWGWSAFAADSIPGGDEGFGYAVPECGDEGFGYPVPECGDEGFGITAGDGAAVNLVKKAGGQIVIQYRGNDYKVPSTDITLVRTGNSASLNVRGTQWYAGDISTFAVSGAALTPATWDEMTDGFAVSSSGGTNALASAFNFSAPGGDWAVNLSKKDNGQIVIGWQGNTYKVPSTDILLVRTGNSAALNVRGAQWYRGDITTFAVNGAALTADTWDGMTDGFAISGTGGGGGGGGDTVTWSAVLQKPFNSVGSHLTVIDGELTTDGVPVLTNNNDFSGLNVFRGYSGFAGNATFTGNVTLFGDDTRKIELYGVDSLTASSTHVVGSPLDFTTKKYVDSVSAGAGVAPAWTAVTGKPFEGVGSSLKVTDNNLEAGDNIPRLDGENTYTETNNYQTATFAGSVTLEGTTTFTGPAGFSSATSIAGPYTRIGNVYDPFRLEIINVDTLTASSTHVVGNPLDFTTKKYVDSVAAGSGVAPAWSAVTGKPFETIGTGLSVTGGALNATGTTTTWATLAGKPFTNVGANLTVTGDALTTSGLPTIAGENTLTGANTFTGQINARNGLLVAPTTDAAQIYFYDIDTMRASATYRHANSNDFTTKGYVDGAVSGATPAWTAVTGKPFNGLGGSMKVTNNNLEAGDNIPRLDGGNSFTGSNSFKTLGVSDYTILTGNVVLRPGSGKYVELTNVDTLRASANHKIEDALDFTTKHYVDSVSAGSGVAPAWSAVTGKPFESVGDYLTVTADKKLTVNNVAKVDAANTFTGVNTFRGDVYLNPTGLGIVKIGTPGPGVNRIQIYNVDSLTASPTHLIKVPKDFTTKEYVDNYVDSALDTVRNFATGRMEYISFTNPNPPAGTRRDQRVYANIGCVVGGSGVSGAGRPNFKVKFSIQGTRGKWATDPAKQDYELLYGWENNGDYNAWKKLFWLGDGFGANESPIVDSVYIVPRGQYNPASDIWVSWRYNDNYMHSIFVTDVSLTQSVDSNAVAAGKSYGGLTPDNRWVPAVYGRLDTIRPLSAVQGLGSQVAYIVTPAAKYAPAVTSAGTAFNKFYKGAFAVTDDKMLTINADSIPFMNRWNVWPERQQFNVGVSANQGWFWGEVEFWGDVLFIPDTFRIGKRDSIWAKYNVEIYHVDTMTASSTYKEAIPEDFTTKRYVDSVAAGAGVAPAWSAVTGKPFETIGTGLTVDGNKRLTIGNDIQIPYLLVANGLTTGGNVSIGVDMMADKVVDIINVDKLTASSTYAIQDDNDFVTKSYIDHRFATFSAPWSAITDRPFDEIGDGLQAEPDTAVGRGADTVKVLRLEDDDWGQDAHQDRENAFMGVNTFSYPVTGATPIDGRHLATKDYVDAAAWGAISTRTLRIPHIDHTGKATTVGHGAWFASFPKGWDVWTQYWLPDTTLVTAYPESGYTVSDWLVNGVSTGMTGAQISFPITKYGDATLTPVLAPPPMFKYSVRAEPADAANVYLNDVENGSITAQQGTVSQIRLHTSGKYPFGNWYMNGVNVDWYCYTSEDVNWPYTWPIAEDAELVYVQGNPITATFNTVAGTTEDGAPTTKPTINGASSATGPYNTVYSFKANIADPTNYIFSHWTRSAADGKGNLDTAGYTADMQYNIPDRGMYVANTFTAYTRPTAEYIKLHWSGLRYCCRVWIGDKVVDLSTKDTILRRADNLVVHLEYRHDSFPDNYPYNVMVADKNLQGTPYRSVFEFNTNDASLPFQTDISVYEWKSSLENMAKVIPSIMRTSKHANPADPDEIVSYTIDGADMAFQNKRYGGLYMPEMDKEYILPPLWFPSDKKASFEITGKTCKWNVHTDIELDVNGKNVNSSTCDFKLPDKVGGNAVNYVKVQVWQSAF